MELGRIRKGWLTGLLIIGTLSSASAQEQVSGRVSTEDGKPVESATLAIKNSIKTATTDAGGNYSFTGFSNGTFSIIVTAVGYTEQQETIVIREDKKSVVKNIILRNNAQLLQQVLVKSVSGINAGSDYVGKMPLLNIENPQVYTSIDKVILEKQLIFTVDDAFRNVTGLQTMWAATGRSGDGGAFVNMRGFISGNSLRNGIAGGITGTIDAANLEKLEVLKGPSATLFGSVLSSYGGVINRVTKKPYDQFGGSVSVSGGSYSFYRGSVNINTPVTKNKELLFRLNAAYNSEDNFQSEGFSKMFSFTPSLTYSPTDRLSINLDLELARSKNVGQQMFFFYYPVSQLGANNAKDLKLDYKNSYMGSGLYQKGRNTNLFGQINYKLSEAFTSSTNISTGSSYSDGFDPYFYIIPTGDGTDSLTRASQSTKDSRYTTFEIQQNLNGDFKIGSLRNRLVLGLDYLRLKDDQFFYGGVFDVVPFNVPGYDYSNFNGTNMADRYKNSIDFTYPMQQVRNTYSAYVSNVLNITKNFNILTALRIDQFDNKGGIIGSDTVQSFSQTGLSPKFGVVYQFLKNKLSLFGNYQNSFKNLGYYSNLQEELRLAKPEQANQYEFGLKSNLLDGRISTTLSYYNIVVKNTLLTVGYNTANIALQAQQGQLRSQGIEAEVQAYLVKGFSLIGGFSYNDSKYLEADETVVGRRPDVASSPILANFNGSYQFLSGSLKGLGFGVGGNYASDNKIQNNLIITRDDQNNETGRTENVFTLPAYFLLNANAFYQFNHFRVAAKVDNFTNQKYWVGNTTVNPQKLISGALSVSYKF